MNDFSWVTESLNTDGFAVIREALDPAYCAKFGDEIIAEYDRLVDLGWRFSAGGRYTGHLNFHTGSSGLELLKILENKNFVEIGERLLGRRLEVFHLFGNMNLPRSRPQDIHQDFAPPSESIVFNVTLVPTTYDNGATEIVPGSQCDRYSYRSLHRSGVLRNSQRLLSNPGDLVIRRGSVWHRGTSNTSSTARPMICISMVANDLPKPISLESDKIGFCANRFYGKYARYRELAEIYLRSPFHWYRMAKG